MNISFIQGQYCKKKVDASQLLGVKGLRGDIGKRN